MGTGLAFVLTSFSLSAQSAEPARPVKTGDEWKMPADVFKRSQLFADSLARSLGLNPVVSKKVYDAYLANTKPVDEIRVGSDSEAEKKEKMKANHESFAAGLKTILTPEQFKRYLLLYSSASAYKNSWILR